MTAAASSIGLEDHPEGVVFRVYVQPRASKNEVVGPHNGALKVKLTAPPVGGAANKMCIAIFAKALGVPKSAVEIIAGQTSRSKTVLVRGEERERIRSGIENLVRTMGSS
jgi:uncharacterized protein